MSDDEADPELLELLRQSLGIKKNSNEITGDTGILKDAEFIYNNSIDVTIDMESTKAAAESIYSEMQKRTYSTDSWGNNELHPRASEGFSDVDIINFCFTMDLLNFSFWSELSEDSRYQVEYRGKRWTGYNSLVASLRRALDGGVPITTPRFWRSKEATDENLALVFFGATDEEMPLLKERIAILRETGEILGETFGDPDSDDEELDDELQKEKSAPLTVNENEDDTKLAQSIELPYRPKVNPEESQTTSTEAGAEESAETETSKPESESIPTTEEPTVSEQLEKREAQPKPTIPPKPDPSVVRLIEKAEHSAGKLVNLLAKYFPAFRDETRYDGKRVRIMKRTQIFAADLWAALGAKGYGEFHDIDVLTIFADYRVPQMLHSLGVLAYSPSLVYYITDKKLIPSGDRREVQLRGCSIWAVELIRREIVQNHPDAQGVIAVLIDFFLYDLAKEREKGADGGLAMCHHRTRSIWY